MLNQLKKQSFFLGEKMYRLGIIVINSLANIGKSHGHCLVQLIMVGFRNEYYYTRL